MEEFDSASVVIEAADAVLAALGRLGREKPVVLVPFAHLSSLLARPENARVLLADLARELRERQVEVALTSFGYHKEFELHYRAAGHPGSVSFRSFPTDA